MTTLHPFFLLLGRASVFWLGAFALLCGLLLVNGVAGLESELGLDVDPAFLATLWFPGAAGWLAGLMIQELQHTSFAHHLPGVRSRIAAGYFATGLGVTLVVAGGLALGDSSAHGLPLLFALALGAYCVGGALRDPLSTWMTFVNTLLVLLVFLMSVSRDVARAAGEHPWVAATVALGIGGAALLRLFGRSTFRRKPFRLSKPTPGRFSLERSREYERRLRLADRPRTDGWRSGYLGNSSWAWVRAAFHETHGALGWRALARAVSRLWMIGLILMAHAWLEKGDMSYGEAVWRSIYDALLHPPYRAPFGERGGLFVVVVIGIAAAGIVTALFKAVALSDGMSYPLSRLGRARVAFRAGLVDAGLLAVILGLGPVALGLLAGLKVGYEVRLDYMPYSFRVLMATLVLMPLGHWGRLQLEAARRCKAENTLVGVIFGIVGFVGAVAGCTWILPRIFVSPSLELGTLVVALLISQLTYRQQLTSYYRTADLA